MIKKVISILLVLCFILITLASCKSDKKASATNASNSSSPKASATTIKTAASTSLPTGSAGAATSTPAATTVATGDIKEYSIELDFKILYQAAGIVFGYVDGSNFMMYQFNTWDYGDNPDKAIADADKKVYFRPHKWSGGAATVISEIDISDTIKWADREKKQHLKITVSESNEIKTYINDKLIDTYTDEGAAYGLFGFRQCTDSGTNAEKAAFDNIVIKNTKTNQIIYKEDFESNVNPFAEGEIKAGLIDNSLALESVIVEGASNVNVIE